MLFRSKCMKKPIFQNRTLFRENWNFQGYKKWSLTVSTITAIESSTLDRFKTGCDKQRDLPVAFLPFCLLLFCLCCFFAFAFLLALLVAFLLYFAFLLWTPDCFLAFLPFCFRSFIAFLPFCLFAFCLFGFCLFAFCLFALLLETMRCFFAVAFFALFRVAPCYRTSKISCL